MLWRQLPQTVIIYDFFCIAISLIGIVTLLKFKKTEMPGKMFVLFSMNHAAFGLIIGHEFYGSYQFWYMPMICIVTFVLGQRYSLFVTCFFSLGIGFNMFKYHKDLAFINYYVELLLVVWSTFFIQHIFQQTTNRFEQMKKEKDESVLNEKI